MHSSSYKNLTKHLFSTHVLLLLVTWPTQILINPVTGGNSAIHMAMSIRSCPTKSMSIICSLLTSIRTEFSLFVCCPNVRFFLFVTIPSVHFSLDFLRAWRLVQSHNVKCICWMCAVHHSVGTNLIIGFVGYVVSRSSTILTQLFEMNRSCIRLFGSSVQRYSLLYSGLCITHWDTEQ